MDITITVTVNDWRDVPHDDPTTRAAILARIKDAAIYAATEEAEAHDVVVKAEAR